MFEGPGKPSGVWPFEDLSDEAVVPVFDVFDPADGDDLSRVPVPVPGDGDDVGVALPGDGDDVGVALPGDDDDVGVALPGGEKPLTVTCRVLEAIALMGPLVARPIST